MISKNKNRENNAKKLLSNSNDISDDIEDNDHDNNANEYEKLLRKHEADIRSYIKVCDTFNMINNFRL